MMIAVRISSPHDCHTVQHREHFLRLHGIITSQSAPRGMSIGHTAPEAISILSGYLSGHIDLEHQPHLHGVFVLMKTLDQS